MAKKPESKKGIVFTIIAVLLLSFMLLSVTLWTDITRERESKIPEKLKADAMGQIIGQLTQERINKFANISAYYALARLANYTALNHTITAAGADGIANVNTSVYQLMVYGSSNGSGSFPLAPLVFSTPSEKQYVISNWAQNLGDAADRMGFVFAMGNVTNFNFSLVDPWTASVSFNTSVSITDKEGTMSVSRNLSISTNFSILGMDDPQVTRFASPSQTVVKNIYANVDASQRDFTSYKAVELGTFDRGYGWAFGKVIDTPAAAIDNNTQYIWATNYPGDEGLLGNLSAYPLIKGVIITDLGSRSEGISAHGGCPYNMSVDTNCIRCLEHGTLIGGLCPPTYESPAPVRIVVNIPFVERNTGIGPADEVVIVNKNPGQGIGGSTDNHMVFGVGGEGGILGPRTIAECGYYVASANSAPSYLQRMLTNSYNFKSKYGIESFVVGEWAGGPTTLAYDKYSREDSVYSKAIATSSASTEGKIRGMSGCRTVDMCKDPNSPIGHFRLDQNTTTRFNMDELACDITANPNCDY